MVGINPGKLRQKVEFYSLIRASDGGGGFTSTQKPEYSTFAQIQAKKASNLVIDNKKVLNRYYEAVIRYASGRVPQVDWRLKYSGSDYSIREIIDVDETKLLIKLTLAKE